MTKVDRDARESNTPPLPLAKARAVAPPVNLAGARGEALKACAEALDTWRIAGPSPASRALESVVGEAIAAMRQPSADAAAEALARSIRSAAEAARLSPREGPRVSTFRHGEPARVWRAVKAAAAVGDDLRTARTFIVAAFETRGFDPRVTLPPDDALGDGFVVTCHRCYSAELFRPDGPGDAGCSQCGTLLSASVDPSGGYLDTLLGLDEHSRDDEGLARGVLRALGFDPHAFSRSARTTRSRQRSGKLKE